MARCRCARAVAGVLCRGRLCRLYRPQTGIAECHGWALDTAGEPAPASAKRVLTAAAGREWQRRAGRSALALGEHVPRPPTASSSHLGQCTARQPLVATQSKRWALQPPSAKALSPMIVQKQNHLRHPPVGDVEEVVFVLVVGIHVRHQRGCGMRRESKWARRGAESKCLGGLLAGVAQRGPAAAHGGPMARLCSAHH